MTNVPDAAAPQRDGIKVRPTPAESGETNDGNDSDRQDIRLAVVMNGGVSLAIWISGVTLELHHLAMARRWEEATYRPLLDLLDANARVDVIAGTSAGGLNGAFLALGLARDRDLGRMRDLWREHGSLEKLLRDPLGKNPPSLLMGDDYFLGAVGDALKQMLEQDRGGAGSDGVDRLGVDRPVELILTGTLWQGRATSFTDDMGTAITEVDHDATFRFAFTPAEDDKPATGDLAAHGVLDELAAAARCTSSFPGAFEPHWVEVAEPAAAGRGPWESAAGLANFRESQYLLDGGVLLNKPIRPALEAVYRQTAHFQVRRVLTYVVPHPGEPMVPGHNEGSQDHPIPQARDVLLGLLTRLRSTDSVSRELDEIRTRNFDAHARRRIRDRLAAAMTTVAEPLSEQAWDGYIEVRIAHAAATIGRLLAAGQPSQPDRWSEPELVTSVKKLLWARRKNQEQAGEPEQAVKPELFFIPQGTLGDTLGRTGTRWDWGATTVGRLGDMTVDVLKRAVWLAPMNSAWRQTIVDRRRDLRATLEAIRSDRRTLDHYWSAAPTGITPTEDANSEHRIPPIPSREGDELGKATNSDRLEVWLERVLDGWDRVPAPQEGPAARRELLYEQALALAGHLQGCADAIAAVTAKPQTGTGAGPTEKERMQALSRYQQAVDPDGVQRDRLRALYNYLLAADGPAQTLSREEVLERMLRLDVVQLAFAGASQNAEQEVELVQFSATDPDELTGVQLHHFGGFYRSSWRINDWLHGRMDGAAHLVRMLLSTERLRQRGAAMTGEPGQSPDQIAKQQQDQLLKAIQASAVSTKHPADQPWLDQQWATAKRACRQLVEQIVASDQANQEPAAGRDKAGQEPDAVADEQQLLETCARAITRSIHTHILREDLPALAEAIRSEGDDCAETSQAWLASYDANNNASAGQLTTQQLWTLWEQSKQVGRERITGEVGSDTFARTAAHAATVAASTVGAPSKPKAVATVLAALRGYTLAVWAMVTFLTRRGRFGPRVVELAVAASGVLLAAAIFVPAMPLAFTLAGVLLLLAGVSAGALLTDQARGVGWRLGVCALLVAAALGGYVYWDWTRNGLSGSVWSLLVKVGIGVLVVLLGWWIARAQPPGIRRDRAAGGKAGRDAGEQAGRQAGATAGRDAGDDAGEQAGRQAGATAGRDAGDDAGEQAGRQAGAKAGRDAGVRAGRDAGGRAGQRARHTDQLLGHPTMKASDAKLEAAAQAAAQQAGKRAGEQAGRKAGEQAGRAAGEQARRAASKKAHV
jgi:patatin-related protein